MKKIEIIETLKKSYNREVRKQLIKSIIADENENDIPNYKVINQIFSYVLSELGWEIAKNTQEWDSTPLDIMDEAFPQIKKTKWYQEQILTAQKTIDIEMRE